MKMKITLGCIRQVTEQLNAYEEEKKKIQISIAWKETPEKEAKLKDISSKINLTKIFLEMLKTDTESFWDFVDNYFYNRKTKDINYRKIFTNVYYKVMPLSRAIMEAEENTEAESAIRMAFNRCIDEYNAIKDTKK